MRLLSSLSSRWLVKAIERASLISATSDSLLTLKIYQTLIEFYLKERKKERYQNDKKKERKNDVNQNEVFLISCNSNKKGIKTYFDKKIN